MSMTLTRREALGALLGAAFAGPAAARPRLLVDVSPLRRSGDNTDADYLEQALPEYLARAFGPGRNLRVRIDSVYYGPPGSNGQQSNNGAVDYIEGVGWLDGREASLTCAVQAMVSFPDIGGYGARLRQDTLAPSFAQRVPRRLGVLRRGGRGGGFAAPVPAPGAPGPEAKRAGASRRPAAPP